MRATFSLVTVFMCLVCLITHHELLGGHGLAITNGHCQKNISVKYQVPVTKTRLSSAARNELLHANDPEQQYVVYEERVRWDTVQICCPGYRTIIFGFCEPICIEACPAHSYCLEPNKCVCMRGYEPSHHHSSKQPQQLSCRPICQGGCPEHSYCVAHNECICRAGYKDVSSWFSPLRCERIPCGPEQRYDVTRRACVKIEMSMEELMQRVAQRLAKGLKEDDAEGIEIENDSGSESESESEGVAANQNTMKKDELKVTPNII